MRIAVITDLWPPFPGGAERFIFNISRELKNRGHEISVLTSYANAAEFDGIKPEWKSVGCRQYDHHAGHTHADGWKDISDFLSAHRADAILTHHFFAHEFAGEFGAGHIPVIQLVHNGRRYPWAKLAIYNSSYTRMHAGPIMPMDMTILPPAFDDCVAVTHGDYIGFIKPIPHKGVVFFYKLASMMPDRNFMVLHGEWQQSEDIRRGLPNVFFMPPVHEMKIYYEKVRVLLVPSVAEDAGTVPQEAALNGIPCLSSNVMGLAETNLGGLVLGANPDLWVQAIKDLDRPVYYQQIADSQREYIKTLNWPGQFDDLSKRIEALCGTAK